MNILFDINHPAHFHLFKNTIRILQSKGHNITITARDKEVTTELLQNSGLAFKTLTKARRRLLGLAVELLMRQSKLAPILIKRKINLCVSVTGACSVHIAKLLGIPSLIFYDTEHATLQNALAIPFATKYITPDCYQNPRKQNQILYPSVHELAYLHPNYFTPNPSIYDELQIKQDEKYVVMRFVSWGASHDVGQRGISVNLKRNLIKTLTPYAKVFIVSEAPLDQEFQQYQLNISPEKIHDALYYATLFIGEGATMASECACLGTPAIYVNSLKLGYISEEAQKYTLIYDLLNEQEILRKSEEIITNDAIKEQWAEKRKQFLKDKIDLTVWMVKEILGYQRL